MVDAVGSEKDKQSALYHSTAIIGDNNAFISQLLSIEEQIRSSHLKEKIHEEHVAVS